MEAVFSSLNVSWAAPVLTWRVTVTPEAEGVTGTVYVVPLPVSVPRVPLVTVIPESVRPVTDSEKVKVKVIGELSVDVPEGVTVTVGAVVL